MRYLAAIALALSLAGAAVARPATRPVPVPVGVGAMVESIGAPNRGSAPGNGELIQFIPGGRFAVGILLVNESRGRLVVTRARVLEPRGTLVHQIGTRFHPWNPPKCPPGALCPAYGFPLRPGVARPRPFVLGPREKLGVELDFRLGSCADLVGASFTPISRLRVTVREPNGATRQRVLWLRGAELHLLRPAKDAACRVKG